MMPASAILRIPETRPELLFTGDETAVHQLYRKLSAQWHPDRNRDPAATDVFQRISVLYGLARQQLASGRWKPARGEQLLETGDGRRYQMRYVARRPFELGELLIAKSVAGFLINRSAADLYESARRTFERFRFGSDKMRQEIAPGLPDMQAAFDTKEYRVLVLRKPADMVLLADLVQHAGGTLPARHAAWILSALYNLACWLEWAQLFHGAIGPETVFVSPERHVVALLGGWWYAVPQGQRLSALPARTVDTVPQDIVRGKTADPRCDLELIRATGRELLGDTAGVRLLRDTAVPRPLAQWLTHPSCGSAVAEYAMWQDVLNDSFGARRFSRLDVSFEQLYSTP